MRVRGGPASARDLSPSPAHLRPDVEAGAEPADIWSSNTALGRTLSPITASCAALSPAFEAGTSTVLVLTRILPDGRSWGTLPAARLLAAVLEAPASLAARPGVAPSAGRPSTSSTLSPSCMRAPVRTGAPVQLFVRSSECRYVHDLVWIYEQILFLSMRAKK